MSGKNTFTVSSLNQLVKNVMETIMLSFKNDYVTYKFLT